MKFDFTQLRWIFLGIYLFLVLIAIVLTLQADPRDSPMVLLILVPSVLATQFLFASSTSSINLCGNFEKKRMLVPAIVAGTAFAVLTAGFLFGLMEVILANKNSPGFGILIMVLIPISWILWTVIFYLRLKGTDPDSATGKLLKWVLLGSVIEMVVLLPMHIITSSRGYCFAGLATAVALMAGLSIALWTFGPGIFLLFVRHYRKQKEARKGGREKP